MKRRQVLASMGALTASGAVVIGSGAYSSAEVERDVAVDVVGDPDAYLGLKYFADGAEEPDRAHPPETTTVTVNDGSADLFRARNQLAADIQEREFRIEVLESDIEVEGLTIRNEDGDDVTDEEGDEFVATEGIGIGRYVDVEIHVKCHGGPQDDGGVVLGIAAGGTGFVVTADREFFIDCETPSRKDAPPAEFRGRAGRFVLYEGRFDGNDLRAWVRTRDGEIIRTETASATGSELILSRTFGHEAMFVFAIEFDGADRVLIRETWRDDECDFDAGGSDAIELSTAEFCDRLENCDTTGSWADFCPD